MKQSNVRERRKYRERKPVMGIAGTAREKLPIKNITGTVGLHSFAMAKFAGCLGTPCRLFPHDPGPQCLSFVWTKPSQSKETIQQLEHVLTESLLNHHDVDRNGTPQKWGGGEAKLNPEGQDVF